MLDLELDIIKENLRSVNKVTERELTDEKTTYIFLI